MQFAVVILLFSSIGAMSADESVFRTAFDTGVLLANESDQTPGPQTCENDCAKALLVEMMVQEISFDQNLFSTLNDSTKFDSICRFYDRQLSTCFPKCAQKPANAVVALLQLLCVDKREELTKNIECAAQMESTMTEVCLSNCLRMKHATETEQNTPLALRQQDACTRSNCVIKCIGAQIRECGTNELKGVYELMGGAQMLMGFQSENALERTEERLRSKDIPTKCKVLMQASYAIMRHVTITLDSDDDVNQDLLTLQELKLKKELQVLDKEPKKLDLEIEKLRLQ